MPILAGETARRTHGAILGLARSTTMLTPERLKRVILSLPDLALRVDWLAAEITAMPVSDAAILLSAVVDEAEAQNADAREALLTIAIFCADSTYEACVDALRASAFEAKFFGLGRLLRRAPPPSIRAPAIEEQRVPDYGAGRELTLGERRSLARRPDRRSFDKLLSDPHPLVIRQLLENPKMVEADAVRLAAMRPARAETIRELVRSRRWIGRPRVRLAIVQNPGSPPEVAMPLLCLCNREELTDVLRSTETSIVLRATAQELLVRHPPVPSAAPRTLH